MATLILMVGLPGSGKSTWAEQYQTEHAAENAVICSSDAKREEIYGDASILGNTNKIMKAVEEDIVTVLQNGGTAIYDATNGTVAKRKLVLARFKRQFPDVHTVCVYCQASPQTCIERQANRARKVPADAIKQMAKYMTMPSKLEGWDEVIYVH